jgi:S-formylglutathione hydrolase FrmB
MSTNIEALIPDKGDGPFRVVYLLHGLHGDQGTWVDNTLLPLYAKKYNAIFVMPEAGRSFYANLKYGRRYYDYMSEELPQVCRKIFNISAKREDTAVMGCSMGGYGALRLALSRPDQYGFCGAIAAACLYFKPMLDALRTDPDPWLATGREAEEILTDLRAIYGDDLEYRKDYDVVELAKNFPDSPRPKIYATCGLEDDLRKDNISFAEEMKNTAFNFTYEEWVGGHEWFFFNEALKKTLEFWHA